MGTVKYPKTILVSKHECKRAFGRIIIQWVLKRWCWMAWAELIWLRLNIGGGLMWPH